MSVTLGMLALLLTSTRSNAVSCQDLEAAVDSKTIILEAAKDDLGTFHMIGADSLAALKQCPDSEKLWYFSARAAEVLEGPMDGKAFSDFGGFKKILAQAAQHEPASARIATIVARQDGSLSSAHRAMALDPSYAPARLVLAIALALNGSIHEALELTSLNSNLDTEHLTRARVLLAANRAPEAAREAEKALASRDHDPVEPVPAVQIQRDASEVLGFALLKENRKPEARKAFFNAAAAGSLLAKRQLSAPN